MKKLILQKISHLIILCLWFIPALAQTDGETIIEIQDKDEEADSAMLDSIAHDTLALPWPQNAQSKITRLLESNMFKTSQLGMLIYDLTADSAIFAHNDKWLMRPASTMKVITAITAIDKLGGDYKFKTQLCYTGRIDSSTLVGDVYCVGGFDPRFNGDDMHAFVETLNKMGIDTIRGHLYADLSMKDRNLLGEGWCWDDNNPELSPLLISRKNNFMQRFSEELREGGVVVNAFIGNNDKPDTAYCIAERFHSFDQILMRMLKESDNLYAESMFYQLAASKGNRPATATDAKKVIQAKIRKMGLDPSHYRIADGSGLSLYNYVSAELIVNFLKYAYKNGNIYNHIYPALPIAGVDGTLKKRMRGAFTQGNVHAKTGTLTGISSLAGYCKAANGHQLCFCIINQGVMHGKNGKAFQNKVCEALCEP